MFSSTAVVAAFVALAGFTVAQSNSSNINYPYVIDPNSVNSTLKASWCMAQKNSCNQICNGPAFPTYAAQCVLANPTNAQAQQACNNTPCGSKNPISNLVSSGASTSTASASSASGISSPTTAAAGSTMSTATSASAAAATTTATSTRTGGAAAATFAPLALAGVLAGLVLSGLAIAGAKRRNISVAGDDHENDAWAKQNVHSAVDSPPCDSS
ncbi:hypothetical protein MRB53_041733 [Persea americana]|nr:hypothetical protein MRB53_041733 [Persea americana]